MYTLLIIPNTREVPILGTVTFRPWLLPSVLMFLDSVLMMIQTETLLADTELKTVWMISSNLGHCGRQTLASTPCCWSDSLSIRSNFGKRTYSNKIAIRSWFRTRAPEHHNNNKRSLTTCPLHHGASVTPFYCYFDGLIQPVPFQNFSLSNTIWVKLVGFYVSIRKGNDGPTIKNNYG